MSTFSTTEINGKKCTAVPRANNVGGGLAATSSSVVIATSSSTSTSTSSTSTSTVISSSTSFSTSTSTSIALTTSTSVADVLPTIQNPIQTDTAVASTQETVTTPVSTSAVQASTDTATQPLATDETTAVGNAAAPLQTTAIGSTDTSDSATSSAGLSGTAVPATGDAASTQTTVAVAGGVIGGLAAISLIVFLIWFWRKRTTKKRRSTLLTPLSTEPRFRDRGEKGPYVINRTSLGPTTVPEKVKAIVGYNYKRIREGVNNIVSRDSNPSVNLNRGNSQFGMPDTPVSQASNTTETNHNFTLTTKERFVDWWGRLKEDNLGGWRLRRESRSNRNDNSPFAASKGLKEQQRPMLGSQPDFLTLLSMDDQQLDREAASRDRGSMGGVNGANQRRSQSLGNEHFLGGLGLNFDDPFSDANVMARDSAKVQPLAVSSANNPFSDANAIAAPSATKQMGPTTYVQSIRRSRTQSISHTRKSSNVTRMESIYRESGASIESFETRRNKFRSDPFDLDRPELLSSNNSSTGGVGGSNRSSRSSRSSRGLPGTPRAAHVRQESFTSKYSSGASLGDWSDPGPDVGPAAGRWDTPTPDSSKGRPGENRKSASSQGSVGKAM
ncbi:hypothetical protein F5Y15DRAFT_131673 [Xylariaceae sp. FL0016]|nr:hypothetical protein F5Y15DRAFT_131673 [Xylariaceae sp. FL0016]